MLGGTTNALFSFSGKTNERYTLTRVY